ncbi:hypothetical protein CDD81_4657 [Ophiocordyceps australis]|uniref:Atos-like conserved domain-containing protein n=1 Tax=Ophiocordyceps australis TaxID=1399860 RepID=A0A2C5Y9P4_9HYPO|nr:hypothetical protein CDD81_4657 [Ophiocordyceps australis]
MPMFQDDADAETTGRRTKLIERLKLGRVHHGPGQGESRVDAVEGEGEGEGHLKAISRMAATPGHRGVVGPEIERPGSALHSGDFTHDKPDGLAPAPEPARPGAVAASLHHETASSWSRPCSFAYQPPTSPLVQSQLNEESRADSLFCHRSLPYQAHQPRRWLSSPHTPAPARARRPSLGSHVSPMQHASMVGSYEESILRGRMSTTPSKPFDFVAQIGVLGRAKPSSSLVCPPHVTLEFPAVYYKYSTTPLGLAQPHDGPSPYVGLIDLENGLPNAQESRAKRKAQTRHADALPSKRPASSPRAPPGGSYRIPEKGQLQIIVKNQNKTAVKLFLVPYDLTGMEPTTKTFIRQRSYSSALHHAPDGLPSRPILRYLVHVHICCPAKGRFYLYKSIRIVFANRVVDAKETLRNETTWPEPRFAPYKPLRVMHPPAAASALLAADKASRRRSLGVLGPPPTTFGHDLPPHGSHTPDSPMLHSDARPADAQAWGAAHYEKLSLGDAPYARHAFADSPQGKGPHASGAQRPLAGAESLLSQRLRTLGVESLRPHGLN